MPCRPIHKEVFISASNQAPACHTASLEPDQYQRTTQRVPWQQIEDLAAAVRQLFPAPAYEVGCGGSPIWLHRAAEEQRLACIIDQYQ